MTFSRTNPPTAPLLFVSIFALTTMQADASAKKPQMAVQVHAWDWHMEAMVEAVDAYLILPDGTHAHGFCMSAPSESTHCTPDSFTPEKRSATACTKGNNAEHCVYDETYSADRKGNELTLYAANGKVTYKIISSW